MFPCCSLDVSVVLDSGRNGAFACLGAMTPSLVETSPTWAARQKVSSVGWSCGTRAPADGRGRRRRLLFDLSDQWIRAHSSRRPRPTARQSTPANGARHFSTGWLAPGLTRAAPAPGWAKGGGGQDVVEFWFANCSLAGRGARGAGPTAAP